MSDKRNFIIKSYLDSPDFHKMQKRGNEIGCFVCHKHKGLLRSLLFQAFPAVTNISGRSLGSPGD